MITRTCEKEENTKSNNIKILRISTYVYIIKQIEGGIFSLDNIKLGCDYCFR